MRSLLRCIASLLLIFSGAVELYARVTRVEITSRTDVLDGKSFGDVGSYERITGRVYYALKVDNWHNTAIVDLRNAVNLKNGEVEFASDFIIVRPKDSVEIERLHAAGSAQPWPQPHHRAG